MGFDKETTAADQVAIRKQGNEQADSDVEQSSEMADGSEAAAEKLEERDEEYLDVREDILEDFDEEIEETAEENNDSAYQPVAQNQNMSSEPDWQQDEVPPSSIPMSNGRNNEEVEMNGEYFDYVA